METLHDAVVLLDQNGRRSGTAARDRVHTTQTPLHLAFSCYLFDPAGRVLLTRRAVTKRSWPGVWTNSFCGHPRPDETLDEAVHRRGREELGVTVRDLRCVLPDFRYRAIDPRGLLENELCPVFTARCEGHLSPATEEVEELRWVTPDDLRSAAASAPWALSPWLVAQVARLTETPEWQVAR